MIPMVIAGGVIPELRGETRTDRNEVAVKKWVIVVVVVATLWLIAGVAAYVSLHQASSLPDVVKSMEQVPGAEGGDWPATWSPDGLRILCGSHGVLTINADGTDEVHLGEGDCPVWSPDGSKIAFEAWAFVPDPSDSSEQPGASVDDMWIANVDGSGMTQLTTDSEGDRDLVWSPDGQRIAFVSSRNGGQVDIWTSKVDGTDLQRLTSIEAQDFDVSWTQTEATRCNSRKARNRTRSQLGAPTGP